MDIDNLPLGGIDARHVDVAILYGLGMKDRAHAVAKQLRLQHFHVSVGTTGALSDDELHRVRDKFDDE